MKKLTTLALTLLASMSFAAQAQMTMSISDHHNTVRVTVEENGVPMENVQVTSSLQGSVKTTNAGGNVSFFKGSSPTLHHFTAVTEDGRTITTSSFIERNR